ncbi:unnamed protein product [Rotaria sp. Silwood1]|nr:unnamed protein product [Rotaria sp. Silwood1]
MSDTESDFEYEDDDDSTTFSSDLTDIANEFLIYAAASACDLSPSDVNYSIDGVDFNVELDGVVINTPLGNLKLEPTSSCLENVNNIAKECLTEAATSALSLSSPHINYSIGEVDFNASLDGVNVNTPLGNFKLDPKLSFTENFTGAVTELLDDSINEEIDQFCSDFNNAAHIKTDGSLYSDGTNSFLACQVDADATIENDGFQANAHADGSLSKHKLGDTDIDVGQGHVYAKAFIGADGMNAVIGAELNTISLKNDYVEANIGLSTKTGVDLSTANVSASVLGLGLNAGTNRVGVDTPIGSFNLKF